MSSTHSLESVTVLVLVIYDSVGKDRLFNEASWSRSPSVFTWSGGPCSRRGPFHVHQLTVEPVGDWLLGHEVLHTPPDPSSFFVWNMEQKELFNEHG